MVVVQAVEFGQDGILAGDEVTLYDFGNLLQVGDHLRVLGTVGEGDAHEGAHIETQGLRFYL